MTMSADTRRANQKLSKREVEHSEKENKANQNSNDAQKWHNPL
jgi:hypothetical protein